MWKQISLSIVFSLVFGFLGAHLYLSWYEEQPIVATQAVNWESMGYARANHDYISPSTESSERSPITTRGAERAPESFVEASRVSTPSVAYIRTISPAQNRTSFFDMFFEGRQGQNVSTGSGVVYTSDGYVITNNHVINNANRIEVILNRRTYDAVLIGTDLSSDLAVLKIEAENLPAIRLGSSEEVEVGHWVLAVGNPFNLASTVTAGIVSAKGRELNLMSSRFPIESFIQTDAAINPGNSGGALVNLNGELVGINTAILSRTGSYTGYGFAIPVDIVRKVADDLIQYGEVQKAFIGATVNDLSEDMLRSLGNLDGVMVVNVKREGAAEKAGLEEGDIITQINGRNVNSRVEFEEQLSYRSPGEQVSVSFLRDGSKKNASAVLQNIQGTTEVYRREIFTSEALGAQLESLTKVERDLYRLQNGVRVVEAGGGLLRRVGLRNDYVITSINKFEVSNPEEVERILRNIKGRVIIEGVNEKGEPIYTSFFLK
jgi:Do/DeqQ family serine protease